MAGDVCVVVDTEDDEVQGSMLVHDTLAAVSYRVRASQCSPDVADEHGWSPDGLSSTTKRLLRCRLAWGHTLFELGRTSERLAFGQTRKEEYSTAPSLGFLTPDWKLRQAAVRIVDHPAFDITAIVLILLNAVLLALEVDVSSHGAWKTLFRASELEFLVLFTLECVMRVLAKGLLCHSRSYLRSPWNCLDLFVIAIGWIEVVVDVNMTILRAARTLRPLRSVQRVEGLRRVAVTFFRSLPRVGDAFALLLFNLVVFSILGTDLFSGALHRHCEVPSLNLTSTANDTLNCGERRCTPPAVCGSSDGSLIGAFGYDGFLDALLLSLKVASLDDWPFDVERHQRAVGHHSWIFFMVIVVICSFFIFSLTLAIVAREMEALVNQEGRPDPRPPPSASLRAGAVSGAVQLLPALAVMLQSSEAKKEDATLATFLRLTQSCDDADLSATDESLNPSAHAPYAASGADDPDAGEADRASETVRQDAAVVGLYRETGGPPDEACEADAPAATGETGRSEPDAPGVDADSPDEQPGTTSRVRSWLLLVCMSPYFRRAFLALTVINIAALAMDHYPETGWVTTVVNAVNFWCSVLFLVEFAMKLTALGVRGYFTDWFNVLDFVLCVLSIPDIVVDGYGGQGTNSLRCFRMMRVARTLRLRMPAPLRKLLKALIASLAECSALMLIIGLYIFVAGVLGTQLFGNQFDPAVTRLGFSTLWEAILSVFIFGVTGEGWGTLMNLAMEEYTRWSFLYFAGCFLLGNCILLNVFVAIITAHITVGDDLEEEDGTAEPAYDEDSTPITEATESTVFEEPVRKRLSELTFRPPPGWSKNSVHSVLFSENAPELSGNSLGCMPTDHGLRTKIARITHNPIYDGFVTCTVLVNAVVIALDSPQIHESYPDLSSYLRVTDVVFAVFFCVEVMMRIIAHGFYCESRTAYLRSDNGGSISLNGWNLVDLTVAVIALVSPLVSAMRSLRALRTLRIVVRIQGVRRLVEHLVAILPSAMHTVFLLLLFMIVWAILGLQLFMGTFWRCNDAGVSEETRCTGMYNDTSGRDFYGPVAVERRREWIRAAYDFDNLPRAMDALFLMAVGDGWADVMWLAVDSTQPGSGPSRNNRPWVSVYYILFMVLAQFLLINFFVGVLVDSVLERKREAEAQDVLMLSASGSSSKSCEDLRVRAQEWLQAQSLLRKSAPGPLTEPPENPVRRFCYRLVQDEWDEMRVRVSAKAVLRSWSPQTQRMRWEPAAVEPLACLWLDDTKAFGGVPLTLRQGTLMRGPSSVPRGTVVTVETSRTASLHVLCEAGPREAASVDGVHKFRTVVAEASGRKDGGLCSMLLYDGWAEGPRVYCGTPGERELTPLRSFSKHLAEKCVELPATDTELATLAFVVVPEPSRVNSMEVAVSLVVLANVVVMGTAHWRQSSAWDVFQGVCSLVCSCVFVLEAAIKILAVGPRAYLLDSWNRVDLLVVVIAFVGLWTELPNGVSVVRAFRIARLLRLYPLGRGLYSMFRTFFYSLHEMVNAGVLLLVVLFTFGAIGVEIFGDKKDAYSEFANFRNVYYSMVLLMEISTTEGWRDAMDRGIRSGVSEWLCRVYFMTFMVVCGILVLNLFVAIVVERYELFGQQDTALADSHHEQFAHIRNEWQRRDPRGTCLLDAGKVVELLKSADKPLWEVSPDEVLMSANRHRLPKQDQSRFSAGDRVEVRQHGDRHWRAGVVEEEGPTAAVRLDGWKHAHAFSVVRAAGAPRQHLAAADAVVADAADWPLQLGGRSRFVQELHRLAELPVPVTQDGQVFWGDFVATQSLRLFGLPHSVGVTLTAGTSNALSAGHWSLHHARAASRLSNWYRFIAKGQRPASITVDVGLPFHRVVQRAMGQAKRMRPSFVSRAALMNGAQHSPAPATVTMPATTASPSEHGDVEDLCVVEDSYDGTTELSGGTDGYMEVADRSGSPVTVSQCVTAAAGVSADSASSGTSDTRSASPQSPVTCSTELTASSLAAILPQLAGNPSGR